MTFKPLYRTFLASLTVILISCSDSKDENNLVDITITASQDIISINFPADIETILSINSVRDFSLQGLKSNGSDSVTITSHVQWSLSDGATSSIDKQGHFTAGSTAELITLNAKFGILRESIQINVSSAQFDQVVELSDQSFSIDMCQSQTIKPVGRYVDENGNEEIRPVDSTIINTIEWLIRNPQDDEPSERAYIETSVNQTSLRTLAAGDIIIQAKATSVLTGKEVTSVDFNQTVSDGLNAIKLCAASDSDLNNCNVNNLRVEKDTVLSLIAVGTYQAQDGSNVNENISQTSKWGISDTSNASIGLSNDLQQLDITGKAEESSVTLSAACGEIDQSLDGIEISQGVTLNTPVSCSSSECLVTSELINIDELSVESFDVSANDIDLTDDVSISLDSPPDEINLIVNANFSNDSRQDITNDSNLVYDIISVDGQVDVIEKIAGSPGVFTVLGRGTAKIQLRFRDKTFIVVIEVPR